MIVDFTEIPCDGEIWELFAEEFLGAIGLTIESPPDRGADMGKDIIAIETLRGAAHSESFRWLVSCKHFAHSNSSVSEVTHERNILERMISSRAHGFMGFYSTLPSAGLNARLTTLKAKNQIREYRILNRSLIEGEMLVQDRSWLMRRYFPSSYTKVRPIHTVFKDFVELRCRCCGKDLLEELYSDEKSSLLAFVRPLHSDRGEIEDLYMACKGDCDRRLEDHFRSRGFYTSWKDILDISKPGRFIQWVLIVLDELKRGERYSDPAFANLKMLIAALGQKVLREVSPDERLEVDIRGQIGDNE